jgi:hypothetical protein
MERAGFDEAAEVVAAALASYREADDLAAAAATHCEPPVVRMRPRGMSFVA